jgi:hypothetical protein
MGLWNILEPGDPGMHDFLVYRRCEKRDSSEKIDKVTKRTTLP